MTNIKNGFKPKCVVDWVELEFHCRTPSPAWRIFKAGTGTFSHVTGLNPLSGEPVATAGAQGHNTPTTRFRARIQEPERFSAIMNALNQAGVRSRIDPCMRIPVTAIEVSFDLYAKPGTSTDDLASLAALLAQGVNRVSDVRPRAYRETGIAPRIPDQMRDLTQVLRDGFCVGIGNREDDLYQRCYVKTFDNNLSLPQEKCRARIEVRLKGNACPISTLDELGQFDFARLAKFFKFRTITPRLPRLTALIASRQSTCGSVLDGKGELILAHSRNGRKRKSKVHTMASPLNEVARDQLRKLTARWKASAGRGRSGRSRLPRAGNDANSGGLAVIDCPTSPAIPYPPSDQNPGRYKAGYFVEVCQGIR